MAYPAGSVFAGFTIDRVLGAGGMGTVYLAQHPRLPRKDALKLLRSDLSSDPGFRTRFEREADLAARLDHRNIVTVYDRGRTDEQLWIDMQYVDGIDASQALEADRDSMTTQRVLRIIREVGAGLDFAHRHGLWHRDVKPANILLSPSAEDDEMERVLLTDFGVAKAVDEARQLTSTGNMLATLAYAAPEQIESRALDHRVDIYALGCVLYELLTGNVPYPEETAYATMAAHLNKPPPRPTVAMPELPAAIDDVVARAMAKDRNDRFATCRELGLAAGIALDPPARSEPARPPQPREQVTATLRRPNPMVPPPAPSPQPSRPDAGGRPSGPIGPRPPFQIRVHRTGGDGVRELGPVYTDALSLLETGALEDLLDRAQFFRLPPHLPAERPVTDDVRQEITVISAGRTHAVGYDLQGSRRPPEMDEFVGRLERLAGWRALAPAPPRVLTGPQPLLGPPPQGHPPGAPPLGHPPQGLAATPWWQRKGPLAGIAAAAVLAIVLTLVLVVGGDDPLAAPASVDAVAGEGTVELSWGEVDGALRYEVRRDGDLLDTTRDTTFVDESIEAGERYRYTVTALGSGGAESEASSPRSVTIPQPRTDLPPPVELTVAREDGVVQVSWGEVQGASSYNLFRGTALVYGGPQTSFADEDAPLGTNVYTVLAAAPDGGMSDRSDGVPITLSETWGDLTDIVAAFPNLLPPTPTETGYEDSTCGVGEIRDIQASGVAVCDYTSGIHLELLRYPDQAALDARIEQVAADNTRPVEEWFYRNDDDSQTLGGTVYESLDTVETASRFATFVEPTRALIAMYVSWPGHTTAELFDTFWLPAPF